MHYRSVVLVLALCVGFAIVWSVPRPACADNPNATRIEHAPIHSALPNQSLTVRARIVGPEPKAVTLFFATSRDAAPFKVPMLSSGPQIYAGSIPDTQLAHLDELYYYIEARDAADNTVETPWYTVRIEAGSAAGSGGTAAGVGAEKGSGKPEKASAGWVKPTLIGGGLLAAGGIAYAVSSGGGGGGGSDSGGKNPYAGTYVGSDTTCTQPPAGSTTCASSSLTITITDQGVVQSDDLKDGQHLEAKLSGVNFVLVADVNENGFKGQVQYVGTVVDQRIVGNIQGSASATSGVAVFSGSFTAVK